MNQSSTPKSNRGRKAKRALTGFLGLVLIAAVSFAVMMARSEGIKLVHPQRTISEQTPADWPSLANWEELRLETADGLELAAWYVPPKAQGEGAALVFVHGLGGNRGSMLPQAAFLAEAGYGALLLDLRNHGISDGEITSLGYYEVDDVRSAVEYLLAQQEVDPERIGLIGQSMGGATVLRAAARIPEVTAVVAESAFTSIEDNVANGVRELTGLPPFPFAPLVIYFSQQEADVAIELVRPIDDIAMISPRPIFFIHGALDVLVPVENSRRMYDMAGGPRDLYIIEDAGHHPLYDIEPEMFEQRMIAFLDTYLR